MRRLATATILALTSAAAWAAPPAGVTESDGAWVSPEGKPLYTFARDSGGKSACAGSCAAAWPPFMVTPDAVGDDDWTMVRRDDGALQWAYKGAPLYTYSRDVPGRPPGGASAVWPPARK